MKTINKNLIIVALIIGFLGIGVGVSAYKVVSLQGHEYTGMVQDNGVIAKVFTLDQEKATCYVATTGVNPYASVAISCLKK